MGCGVNKGPHLVLMTGIAVRTGAVTFLIGDLDPEQCMDEVCQCSGYLLPVGAHNYVRLRLPSTELAPRACLAPHTKL